MYCLSGSYGFYAKQPRPDQPIKTPCESGVSSGAFEKTNRGAAREYRNSNGVLPGVGFEPGP